MIEIKKTAVLVVRRLFASKITTQSKKMVKNKLTKKYLVLESRNHMGGTWDLFRYPGIRSDSDMHTLGYSFKPWQKQKAIANGSDIAGYIRESAAEYGVEKHIRYGHTLIRASWESGLAKWRLKILRLSLIHI